MGFRPVSMGIPAVATLMRWETAIGFNLRDWWQPTAENFLGLLSKNQIVGGVTGSWVDSVAVEAAKLKKGDAAILAERSLSDTRWVPGWMQPRIRKIGFDNDARYRC